jgi:hypothetical protein
VIHHPGMQEVLVDRRQLVLQELIQLGNDLRVAFHGEPPRVMSVS